MRHYLLHLLHVNAVPEHLWLALAARRLPTRSCAYPLGSLHFRAGQVRARSFDFASSQNFQPVHAGMLIGARVLHCRYGSEAGGSWAGSQGQADLRAAETLIKEALQGGSFSVPVAALQVGYLTGWATKIFEGSPEYDQRMKRPHAGDDRYVPRIWSSQPETLLIRDQSSPSSAQEGADAAAEHLAGLSMATPAF